MNNDEFMERFVKPPPGATKPSPVVPFVKVPTPAQVVEVTPPEEPQEIVQEVEPQEEVQIEEEPEEEVDDEIKNTAHYKLSKKIKAAILTMARDIAKVDAQIATLETGESGQKSAAKVEENAKAIQSALKLKTDLAERKVELEKQLAGAEIEAQREVERGDADRPRERLAEVERGMAELKERCEYMVEEIVRLKAINEALAKENKELDGYLKRLERRERAKEEKAEEKNEENEKEEEETEEEHEIEMP